MKYLKQHTPLNDIGIFTFRQRNKSMVGFITFRDKAFELVLDRQARKKSEYEETKRQTLC